MRIISPINAKSTMPLNIQQPIVLKWGGLNASSTGMKREFQAAKTMIMMSHLFLKVFLYDIIYFSGISLQQIHPLVCLAFMILVLLLSSSLYSVSFSFSSNMASVYLCDSTSCCFSSCYLPSFVSPSILMLLITVLINLSFFFLLWCTG